MRDVATRSFQYKAYYRQNPDCRAGVQASGGMEVKEMVGTMISGLVFVVIACAAALACVLIAWAARGAKAEEGGSGGRPSDLLLYASMIDDGILLLQDGALMATWRYAGPDLGSATHEEMAALAERLNSVLKLGSGWLVHCDAIRCEVNEYAKQGAFQTR